MSSLTHAARASHPAFPWLTEGDCDAMQRFLNDRGWINPGERVVACDKAGEGNMNLTLRVRMDRRTFIVKQGRPWVEKYDHIAAPWDRSVYEQRFYERVATIPSVANMMPSLLAADAAARTLMLEDLPNARDFTGSYSGVAIIAAQVLALAGYLAALHRHTRGAPDPQFGNRNMRALNHEHIFVVPLAEANGLDLDAFEPGLEAGASHLQHDTTYRERVASLAERYLADGPCLVHGDYFPGSWLDTAGGVKIIDPEFCFYGEPEFDLGVAIAHFALARQPRSSAEAFLSAYTEPFDPVLASQFAAVEVMRRLIGVAQLPISKSAGMRAPLLERSRSAMINADYTLLWK